jgi:cytochrome c biogenesis protein ResB
MKPSLAGLLPHGYKRAWRWLARPAVLAALVIALLALLALGTLLPQLPTVAPGPAELDEWRALAQTRYGPLAALLEAVGAFRLYRSPLLWTLIALLGAATLSCTLRRWPGKWQSVFSPATRPAENTAAALSHEVEAASHSEVLELAESRALGGAEAVELPRLDLLCEIARGALVQHDYRVRDESMPDLVWLQGDRNRLSALGTLVDHMAVLMILAGVCLSTILGWRESLTMEPGGTAQVGHGSGITLHSEGFEVERYQDGSPAAYTAQVTIERGGGTERRAIGVNQPASTHGIRFYLQGYRLDEGRYAVTLMAVHDPGYGVVVLGGLLFLAGILVALYFPRSSVRIRITGPSGTLRLTGWADHRAYDFDRDFAALAADLRQDWRPEADRPFPTGSSGFGPKTTGS